MLLGLTAACGSDDDGDGVTIEPGPPPVYRWDLPDVPIGGLTVRHCSQSCDDSGCHGDTQEIWRVQSARNVCLQSPITHGVAPDVSKDLALPTAELVSGNHYMVQVLKGCDGSLVTWSTSCFVAR